jgi:cell wall-associated NlpC family hydrolase
MNLKTKLVIVVFALLLPLQSMAGSKQSNAKRYASRIITEIIHDAKAQLGRTYKWGANGPFTYDCSGFTKAVFKKNGIKLPRISQEQAKVGRKVAQNQLKQGDLLFFDSKESPRVSHVGIYLGNGKFIHASTFHKRIVISPFREYKRFFKWGRRLT